jgi:hypothetical protein
MFRRACKIAQGFTFPVVISRKTIGGDCSSLIGTFIVVNKDGWILTAHHIIQQLVRLIQEENVARDLEVQRQSVANDDSLSSTARKRKLGALKRLDKNHTDRVSAWWGKDGVSVTDVRGLKNVDLGIGRLVPFDPTWVPSYPVFKDPSQNFDCGASLCKLGYPFHSITPTWNADNKAFELPQGSLPLPPFPIDGIYTRTVKVAAQSTDTAPFPMLYLETSTPGLRGQSGGPIFDTDGNIWAIQSRTAHFDLGFAPKVKRSDGEHTENQFLNIGLGVHVETILGLLDQQGIDYQMSDD